MFQSSSYSTIFLSISNHTRFRLSSILKKLVFSYFETDFVIWFVQELMKSQQVASHYYKTCIPLQNTHEQVQLHQLSETCLLSEDLLFFRTKKFVTVII